MSFCSKVSFKTHSSSRKVYANKYLKMHDGMHLLYTAHHYIGQHIMTRWATRAEDVDRLAHWDSYCRARLSEGAPAVLDFFSFYAEEYPGYFAADDIERLSLAEKVGMLRLQTIAVHDSGDAQTFAIDFTFDGEEVLCVLFDADFAFDRIVWES